MPHATDFEIAIVGGGPAGLSAALVLGRSRRRVVLFDAGAPRNAPAAAAHNVYTRDGTSPLELNRIGREQLEPYPSVQIRPQLVDDAERRPDGTFVLHTTTGPSVTTRHLVLATGVIDELPPIEGLRELWGTGVFHCPYCHGWEVRDRPFVLLAQSDKALHAARILRGWTSDLTLCPVGAYTVPEPEAAALAALGVHVHSRVTALVGAPDGTVQQLLLSDGSRLGPAAVFTSAPLRQRSPLAQKLGCTIHEEGRFAGMVRVDERGFSGVPGLWVIGDAAQGLQQVISAANDGTVAGAMLNAEMLLADQLPWGPASSA